MLVDMVAKHILPPVGQVPLDATSLIPTSFKSVR